METPGTFVAQPQDLGMLYQWNRNIGWSTTNPMINSNGGTTWDKSTPTGDVWEKVNDPSPTGWRVPTREELQKLQDIDKVTFEWTAINGVDGIRFTDKISGNSFFLPAAGQRDYSSGTLFSEGTSRYWSSKASDALNAYMLEFNSGGADWSWGHYRRSGFSVRSVAE